MHAHHKAAFMGPKEALHNDAQNQPGRKSDNSLELTEGWI